MHRLNWDDLRIFLAVARVGRFAAAAARLGVDHTTVARRVSALESALSATLISRSPQGVVLTSQGERLAAYAEQIEESAIRAEEELGQSATRLVGSVRLSTPEAFGTWLVAPNVHRFSQQHPALELELVAHSQTVSLSKREADVAVVLNRPPKGRLVAQRLAGYELGVYATREYLDRHAPIGSVADLRNHPIVWYIDELLQYPELRFLHEIVSETPPSFRSNSIVAQHAAVAAGAGLGFLHKFAAARDSRLVPVLPDLVRVQRTYWVTMHADLKHVPRIRAVLDFLKDTVARYPEFLDASPRGGESRRRG
jgi:DNA-binding transcriptional LysR family regulator